MPTLEKLKSSQESGGEDNFELTDDEKLEIQSALDIITAAQKHTDESIEAECNAEQKILSYGRKALPFLAERLSGSPDEYFQYTLFADALSEEQDLDLLMNNLETENAVTHADGSVASTFSRYQYDVNKAKFAGSSWHDGNTGSQSIY
jgi:hypothetical protein